MNVLYWKGDWKNSGWRDIDRCCYWYIQLLDLAEALLVQ